MFRIRSPRRFTLRWLLLIVECGFLFITGCSSRQAHPDLGTIYNELAQAPDYQRNPVIVIPGVLGSRLIDNRTGQVVWGDYDQSTANPRTPEGARLIALPMAEGMELAELRDSVCSDGPLDQLKIRLFGIPIRINAYAQILATLGVGGFRDRHFADNNNLAYGDDHFTCFQFDYDWRRDVSENAVRLHQFILARKKQVEEQYRKRFGMKRANVKFDIVAHSMGGLLTRYYLRYGCQPLPQDGSLPALTWHGSRHVQRVVLVATPNAGSAFAISQLIHGYRVAPLLPKYSPAVLGTMPAIYQLLPRPRHGAVVDVACPHRKLDIYDSELWRQMQWGLADPRQDKVLKMLLPQAPDRMTRLRIALGHQRKCLLRARQLHQSLDFPALPPPWITLHLFAGDSVPTDDVVAVNSGSGKIHVLRQTPGDGTVARSSAVLIERFLTQNGRQRAYPIHWTSKMFLPADHLTLTSHPIFIDNVLSLLLESSDKAGYNITIGQ